VLCGLPLVVGWLLFGPGSHHEWPYGPEAFCRARRTPSQSEAECLTAQLEAIEIIRRSYGPSLRIKEGSEAAQRNDACIRGASVGNLTDQVALLHCLEDEFGPR
jgi:hypothetical protein